MTKTFKSAVATDHFQFLVADASLAASVDTARLWDDTTGSIAQIGSELVAVRTLRYGGLTQVIVEVDASDSAAPDQESWEALGHFVITAPSGILLVWGPELVDLGSSWAVPLGDCGRFLGLAYVRGRDLVADESALTGSDQYLLRLSRA